MLRAPPAQCCPPICWLLKFPIACAILLQSKTYRLENAGLEDDFFKANTVGVGTGFAPALNLTIRYSLDTDNADLGE